MTSIKFNESIKNIQKEIKNDKLLFVDKYTPLEAYPNFENYQLKSPELFHSDIYSHIDFIAKYENFPHILIYGPAGCGKATLAKYIIHKLYGKSKTQTIDRTYIVKKPLKKAVDESKPETKKTTSESKTEVVIQESPYHIEIDMRINSKHNKFLTQNMIIKYASETSLIDIPFRVIIFYGCELISYYSQTALRSTIETYSKNLRFIMITRNTSQIIQPIKSRLHPIKIKPPTEITLCRYLKKIAFIENIDISNHNIDAIVSKSERNIKTALWNLQLQKEKIIKNDNYETEDNTAENDSFSYDKIIDDIVSLLSDTKKNFFNLFEQIVNLMYLIITTTIDETNITSDILKVLISRDDITEEKKKQIIFLTAETDKNLQRSNRKIIQLNEYIIKMMKILRI